MKDNAAERSQEQSKYTESDVGNALYFALKAQSLAKPKKRFNVHPVEAVIGGLVAAGLIAAWLIVYLQPVLSAKSEVAREEAKIANAQSELAILRAEILVEMTKKLNQEKKSLEEKAKSLAKEKESLSAAKEALSSERDVLVVQIDNLLSQNKTLQQQQADAVTRIDDETTSKRELLFEIEAIRKQANLAETQRDRLQEVKEKTQNQLLALQTRYGDLQRQQSKSQSLTQQLGTQRQATILSGLRFQLRPESEEMEKLHPIRAALLEASVKAERIEVKPDITPYNSRYIRGPRDGSEELRSELAAMFPEYELDMDTNPGLVRIFP